jgi:hypothetical protein
MKRNKLNSVWKEYCFILQEEFEDTKGLSEYVIYHLFLNMSNTTDSTIRGGTVYDYPCGALESTPVFSGVRV